MVGLVGPRHKSITRRDGETTKGESKIIVHERVEQTIFKCFKFS